MTPIQSSLAWPLILQRYVQETGATEPEYLPRRVKRRFHGLKTTVWQGHIHVEDIHGWVENRRLKYYLQRWRATVHDPDRSPTDDEIYQIMLEADAEQSADLKKPFHLERIARNIARNAITEPIIVFAGSEGVELWDGNRRTFGTRYIMRQPDFEESVRREARWIPAEVILPQGSATEDQRLKHAVVTEMNFVEKDHIPWPAFVKAEQVHDRYHEEMAGDIFNATKSKQIKQTLAEEFGLKGWRVADRWIKMYDRAQQFKEYHEEEQDRAPEEVDLIIQDKFEYFDELSKPGVWGVLEGNPDQRDIVFRWLWDGKFKAFSDVRKVPEILANPEATRLAEEGGSDGVREAIATVMADDPKRLRQTVAANERIRQFAAWLNNFRREDYKKLNLDSLRDLREVVKDVTLILAGLLSPKVKATKVPDHDSTRPSE